MSGSNRRAYDIILRAAISTAVVTITWTILYYTFGVTTVSTILAVLAVGISILFL
jgi:hypothetical protein